jgi:hypothetical protein
LLLNQGVTVTNVDIVVGSRGSNSEEDSVIWRNKTSSVFRFTSLILASSGQVQESDSFFFLSLFGRSIAKSTGTQHRVALVRTDVSDECIANIIRMKRISEPGSALAVTSSKSHTASQLIRRHSSKSPPWKPQIIHSISWLDSVAETYCVSCEVRTRILYPRRRHSIHRRGNLKSYIAITGWTL